MKSLSKSKRAISKIVLAVILVCVLIVAAFAVYYFTRPPAPEGKKILTIAGIPGCTYLDPHIRVAAAACDPVYSVAIEGLLTWDENMEPKPSLATSWEAIDNYTWRFHLREGVKFHDQTPFNATAAKYNFDRMMNQDSGSTIWTDMEFIESVEVEDDYTIIIKTEVPSPGLPEFLAVNKYAMLSPSAIEEFGLAFGINPIATGPFKFAEWSVGSYVRWEKFEDYWGGEPKIDEIVYKFIPEELARFTAFKAGEVDVVIGLASEMISQAEQDPNAVVVPVSSIRTVFLWLNPDMPPLDDERVRKAIFHAIDRETIVTNIVGVGGEEAFIPVWGRYVEGKLADDYFGAGGPYNYDPEKAKTLLNEAGWIDTNGDGIREKNGEPLIINWRTTAGRNYKDNDVVEACLPYFEEIGIDASMTTMESADLFALIIAQEVPAYLMGWNLDPWPETDLQQMFYVDPQTNRSKWAPANDEELWSLCRQTLSLYTPEERISGWTEIQQRIVAGAYCKAMYHINWIYIVRKGVNIPLTPDARDFVNCHLIEIT